MSLNTLSLYKIRGAGTKTPIDFKVAAADIEGALEMAREHIGDKGIVLHISHKGNVIVEQPGVE